MSEQAGTVEILARELGRIFEPLADSLTEGEIFTLFAEMGIEFPAELSSNNAFMNALSSVANKAGQLPDVLTDLKTAIDDEDIGEIVSVAADIAMIVKDLVTAFDTIATELDNIGALPGLSAADIGDFAQNLAVRLVEYAIIRYMQGYLPVVAYLLAVFEIVELEAEEGDPADPAKPAYFKRRFHFDRIPDIIDPGKVFKDRYQWGEAGFDADKLLLRLRNFLSSLALPVSFEASDDPAVPSSLNSFWFSLLANPDTSPPGLSAMLRGTLPAELEIALPFFVDGWEVVLESRAELAASTGVDITPPAQFDIIPPSGEATGEFWLKLVGTPPDGQEAFMLIGQPGIGGLMATGVETGLGARFQWDSDSGKAKGAMLFEAALRRGRISVNPGDADGFLAKILPEEGFNADFDLVIGIDSEHGFYFEGSSALEISLPVHIEFFGIEINAATLKLGSYSDTLPIELGATFKLNLGPLVATVENIGTKLELDFPGSGGNLGPLDIGLGFKPPNGVGLSIDAGAVKGGGYLFFDFEKEEYAGVLELDLSGIVSVKAISLITTRMPDGSKGFSMLMIITAEFGSPIQLGFGFTLSGVGGLLGLNRTMRLEAIAGGVRDGGINSIMFPQNVVENAPRILSDLKNYFPTEEGTFLIGPMVKIGWGTPNLVTVSLGIIIEIPGNIAILGVLKVALPDEDAALIVIQVSFIGAIEFDKERLWFFASLYESRVLFITLEGEMGLLVGWGDDANFVVSVGGFHPAFQPPPLPFGSIARIAINILNTDFARIRVEGYFAVTSNSVQFGAGVELYFGVSAFNIDGHLAFDALFRFSPFYFIISISASLSVKVFGIGLFSVSMRGSLEGPTPWHVEGTGSISLLFFSVDVDFSHTWGNEEDTSLPPISVMPLLLEEFNKLENWQTELPSNSQLLVTLRKMEDTAGDLILHPLGRLKVSQRTVPLDVSIDKLGNQKPDDADRFGVAVDSVGLAEDEAVEESFAVGQYFDKSDNELLNAKSFEPIKGGIALSVSGEQNRAPAAVKRVVRYEEIIIDTQWRRHVRPLVSLVTGLFGLFLKGNAVARSVLSARQRQQLVPYADRIEIGKTLYAVTLNTDNTAYDTGSMNFTSAVQAQDYLQQQLAIDANLATQLHVIPQVEMREAA